MEIISPNHLPIESEAKLILWSSSSSPSKSALLRQLALGHCSVEEGKVSFEFLSGLLILVYLTCYITWPLSILIYLLKVTDFWTVFLLVSRFGIMWLERATTCHICQWELDSQSLDKVCLCHISICLPQNSPVKIQKPSEDFISQNYMHVIYLFSHLAIVYPCIIYKDKCKVCWFLIEQNYTK